METNFVLGYICISAFVVFFVFLTNIRQISNSAKNHLQNHQTKAYFLMFVGLAFSAIFLLPFIALVFFFGIFRKCLGGYLKFKHGNKFGGFLENLDCAWTVEDVTKAIILQGIIVEFEGNFQEFFQKIKKRLKERLCPCRNPKLGGIKRSFLGYQFVLKDEYGVDDCITICRSDSDENTITEEAAQKLLTRISNESLPKNNTAFWDLVIINKPLLLSDSTEERQKYLVVLRVHHSLCDGISTQKIIVGCLSDREDHQEAQKDNFEEIETDTLRGLSKITKILTIACLAPIVCFLNSFRNTDDTFEDTKLCGDRLCVWEIEKEPKYFGKVQDIKKSLRGVTFTEIILSAMSASFVENILKNSTKLRWLSTWVTTNPYLRKFPRQHHGKKDLFVLNNDVTSTNVFWAPGYLDKTNSSIDRLKSIQKQYGFMKNSYDAEVFFWMFRIMSIVLPNCLSKVFFHRNYLELCLSNLPGLDTLKLFGGCRAVDIFMQSPNYSTTGFNLNVNTYQNRFQLALMADKTMLSDEESARNFLKGVFHHLDLLHKELCTR